MDSSHFNPRPPRRGRRPVETCCSGWSAFQSTPSAKRATEPVASVAVRSTISIHALREEGDIDNGRDQRHRVISIHALREEGDSSTWSRAARSDYFNPRPPRRGRPIVMPLSAGIAPHFNPRPPRRGRLITREDLQSLVQFQSTPSAKRATLSISNMGTITEFQSTPSAKRATAGSADDALASKFQSTPSAKRATKQPPSP